MLKRLRERAGSESGFTLIELLVVMLILGILAAIAIPAFFNQRGKANDASAKAEVRSMQTAMETCATDNGGLYPAACNLAALQAIEPTIGGGTVTPGTPASGYTIRSAAAINTGNLFTIVRAANGTITRSCTTGATGGCAGVAGNGTW